MQLLAREQEHYYIIDVPEFSVAALMALWDMTADDVTPKDEDDATCITVIGMSNNAVIITYSNSEGEITAVYGTIEQYRINVPQDVQIVVDILVN